MHKLLSSLAACAVLLAAPAAMADATTEQLYTNNCAECHGADRLGRQGPALLPQNLKRLRKKRAIGVIAKGRPATQMPAFGADEILEKHQINDISEFVRQLAGLDHDAEAAGRGAAPYQNIHGAGFRAVYDFADLDRSVFVIATGQSGHILSRHYDDLAELWQAGEYISMSMNREDIEAGALGVSRLRPREE